MLLRAVSISLIVCKVRCYKQQYCAMLSNKKSNVLLRNSHALIMQDNPENTEIGKKTHVIMNP